MRQGVIAAISTPPGKGGVAIIRMSGSGAFDIIEKVFLPKSGRSILSYPPRTQVYGYILYNEEKIDDGLVSLFPAPHSYTGEDTVEISCHGGMLITRTVLEALLTAGAIPAEAGEFTRRAFVNGRLSLTEAEAIGNLLEAKSHEQIRLSSAPARSRLTRELEAIRESLVTLLGSVWARIDYPDEDLGDFTDAETLDELIRIRERLARLTATYRTGRAINEGILVTIAGKPNVGKSTLYNALIGEDAAIVTEIAGTTRDVLERDIPLGRVMLRLTDTAGIRDTGSADTVEAIGIDRSLERIERADLILAVFDLSRPMDSEDAELIEALRTARGVKICILNKSDITPSLFDRASLPDIFEHTLTLSARDGEEEVISELTEAVNSLFTDEKISVGVDPIVASARQHSALVRAGELIDSAILAYRQGISADCASSDIQMALGVLMEIDGRAVSESIVEDIFSRFCVGK